MRVLGLDPGLRATGWGVIEAGPGRLRHLACGVVASPAEAPLARRLDALFEGLLAVIERWAPDAAAVEETVVNLNAASSLKLGQARGVVLLAAARSGLEVGEYAARTVKRAVTGTGSASKEQVAAMVRALLPGAVDAAADATDALAVAICHAHVTATRARLARGVPTAGARAG
ncbi:MAG: crossover junction endodeoxyribonuclease RuvC [Geminicoccaceae bacterium]|nr:MAG: crossover junction endodeoxyribonuclease RuvC [Geminicoccaceae bacterium]